MKKLYIFNVLYAGWELDYVAYIGEKDDGSRCLIMTNHGREYEADISELEHKIVEYEMVLADSRKALEMLNAA